MKGSKDPLVSRLFKESGFERLTDLLIEQTSDLKNLWRAMGYLGRGLVSIAIILLSPILVAFVAFHATRLTFSAYSRSCDFRTLGGYFSPTPGNEDTIYINKKKTQDPRSELKLDHIITHEHIHFLQHRDRKLQGNLAHKHKFIRDPNLIIDSKYTSDAETLY